MKKSLAILFFIGLFLILNSCGSTLKEKQETIKIADLKSPIKIYEDNLGIYHIYGQDDGDVALAQGFIQAKTRLFFMEFIRRLSKGDLAYFFGDSIKEIKEVDIFAKTVQFNLKGGMIYDTLSENLTPAMAYLSDEFCKGVNAYIKGIKEGKYPLPEEFKYYDIPPEGLENWDRTDIAAIGRLLQYFLSAALGMGEVDINIWENKLPQNLIGDWIRFKPATPTTTMYGDVTTTENIPYHPQSITPIQSQLLTQLDTIIHTLKTMVGGSYRYGSNNWVISGKITKDGRTLLANDPHLPLFTPPIWEIFHLHSGGEDATGFAGPGLPGLLIGVTDHIAWGETVAGYDVADYYFEKISCEASSCFAMKGNQKVPVKMAVVPHKVRVDSGKWVDKPIIIYYIPGEEVILQWDQNGVETLFPSATTQYAIGFKWTGQNITNEFEAFSRYLKAKNVEEFSQAVTYFEIGAQNQVVIDREGNIGYFPHAMIPVRSSGSRPWKVMDGFNNEGKWIGYLPESEIPYLVNPSRGFINTSNNDILGVLQNNDPATQQPYYYSTLDIGFRAKRVEELIMEGKEKNELDLNYMKKIQRDVKSLLAERTVKFIIQAAKNRPDLVSQWGLSAAIEKLKKWDFFLYSGIDHGSIKYDEKGKEDSVAASIFSIWWREFVTIVLGDEVEYYGVPFPDADFPARQALIILHILEDPPSTLTSYNPTYGDSDLFDDVRTPQRETRDYMILKALKLAIDDATNSFSTDRMESWNWGKIHRLIMINPFIPGSRGMYPTDGGEYTVNLASTTAGFLNQPVFIQVAGPSMRMVVEMDKNGVHAEASLPGANNADYRSGPDLFNYWWEYRYFTLPLNKPKEKYLKFILEP